MSTQTWHELTTLGEHCNFYADTHCSMCEPDGTCDRCNTVEGRDIELVSEYASTCDWCADLTHHDNLTMDLVTQLGYCPKCLPKLPAHITVNLDPE